MEAANIVVIGAGVVGLAVASRLSEKNQGVYVFERNTKFGMETSSHNSGVIHSGIHYPPKTLKAKLCVKGNEMTYNICRKFGISYKPLGKLTVAIGEEEEAELEKLMKWGRENGVDNLRFMSGDDVRKLEPNVDVDKALLSPSTGILEPDELMAHFEALMRKNGVTLATETNVQNITRTGDGYGIAGVSVGEKFNFNVKTLINCAGLGSDKVAQMVGLDIDKLGYRLHFWKGDYFRVGGKPPVKMLVYPVPKGAGLGIHLTPDMSGSVRLGPNAYYVHEIDYSVESEEREFRQDVERFVPSIRDRAISADSAGVRPKLQGPNDSFRDFVIRHEADRGLFGFINLIGIESPGLTAAPAIAESIDQIYEDEIRK